MALTSWSTTVRHHPEPEADDLRATLDRYVNDADRDDADILVRAIPMPEHLFNVLEQSVSIDQLVVIGTSNPDLTSELLGRRAAKILRKSNCSVIIARGDVSEYHEQLVRVMTRESKCRVLPMITRFW
jgi:hypothetical protein